MADEAKIHRAEDKLSSEQTLSELKNVVAKETTLQDVKNNTDKLDVPLSSLTRLRVYEQTFEQGTTDTTANNCSQNVQSTEKYAGNYALQVDVLTGETGYIETPSRPVSANQQVTFSFAHKEDTNITDIKLIVVWRRSSGGIISTEEFTLTPSQSWQIDSRTITAPQNAATMTMRMQATAGASNGVFYLDEITIDLVGQILRVDGAGNLKVSDDGLESLDVDLSTRASESTLLDILAQLDITLSALRDAICDVSPNNKTLNDLYLKLNSILTELQQKTEPSNNQNVKVAGTTKTIYQAAINFSTSGDNVIVSADASNKIKVVSIILTVGGETNLTFKRGTTAISGAMDFGGTNEPRGMVACGTIECPILETGVNQAFIINSSNAVQVSGWIRYYKEP